MACGPDGPTGKAPAEIIPKRSPKSRIEEIAKGMGLNVRNASAVELKADIYFKHLGLSMPKHQAIYEKLIRVLRTNIGMLKQDLGWTQGGHPTKETVVLAWLRSESHDAPWPREVLAASSGRIEAQNEQQIAARPFGAGRSPFDTITCIECKGDFWASAAELHQSMHHVSTECAHCSDVLASQIELNAHVYERHHAQWEEEANRAR